ncbi:MAG: hypothetical protein CMR00_06535 [[Chlorobium] sp. 445]|nr:MAG: hypothetical protein CMR00_06535 [[Chlorobium] sp. 445]
MQKRRKNRWTKTHLSKVQLDVPSQKVFREDILELKYRFWIARAKFARGELSLEELRKHANALIDAVEERRNQVFGQHKPYRLGLCAAELIANPFLLMQR